MRLDGVNGVRLGSWSLCHQAGPGEVELLHKVQAGIQAQCRVLHKTDLVSPVLGLVIGPAVPASPDTGMSRRRNRYYHSHAGDLIWPLASLKHMHKGLCAKRSAKNI